MMKTIYLDHNIVHYYVKSFPVGWSAATEEAAIQDALLLHPEVRFVVSGWNLVEAARDCEGAPSPLSLASTYATFFEALKPLFVEAHDVLQREEMAQLAFRRWNLPTPSRTFDWMFSSHFSQLRGNGVNEPLIGYDLRQFLHHLVTTPSSLQLFKPAVATSRAALATNIAAHHAGKHRDKTLQLQVLEAWFFTVLPQRDSTGRWITEDVRKALASELALEPTDVFRDCPTVGIESIVAEIRSQAGGRLPKDSDTFDLMHVVPVLTYCDAFVSADSHLRGIVSRARQEAQRSIIVADRLSEAIKQI